MNSIKKIFIVQNLNQVTTKIKFCLLFLVFTNSAFACLYSSETNVTGPKATYTGNKNADVTIQGLPDGLEITLADNEINRNHVYYKSFTTNPDPNFIAGLYYLNSQDTDNQVKLNGESKKVLITDKGGNNSLIFKVKDGTEIYFDTLRNTIHPSTPGNEELGNIVPIAGSLPTGVMSSLENEPSGNTDLAVYLTEYDAQVKIDVTTRENKLVVNLVDRFLNKGDHKFTWEPGSEHVGQYHLHITVDGQKMTYKIDVE